mmetsp:Transcript_11782/g.22402  ORF Transcript_11782/g.22402 Transcript_11782/m.22402 type:complete len:439 (+) Transcript_11782:1-1317(+)
MQAQARRTAKANKALSKGLVSTDPERSQRDEELLSRATAAVAAAAATAQPQLAEDQKFREFSALPGDDSDAWMAISPTQLDSLLSTREVDLAGEEDNDQDNSTDGADSDVESKSLGKSKRDEWGANLNIDFSRLNSGKGKGKTGNKQKPTGPRQTNNLEEEEAKKLGRVVSGVKGFVNKVSSFQGATFADQGPPDMQDAGSGGVDLDFSKLITILQDMEGGGADCGVPLQADADTDGLVTSSFNAHLAALGVAGAQDLMPNSDSEDDSEGAAAGLATASGEALSNSTGTQDQGAAAAGASAPPSSSYDFDSGEDSDDDDNEDGGAGADGTGVEHGASASVRDLMRQMDAELQQAGLSRGATTQAASSAAHQGGTDGTADESRDRTEQSQPEGDELAPVDVDFNLVQNFLESFGAQEGTAGPVGNLLGQLGIQLPAPKS